MSMSYSFTKKGTGRRHNYSGVALKVTDDAGIDAEYSVRERCGALTETFLRKYCKAKRNCNKKESFSLTMVDVNGTEHDIENFLGFIPLPIYQPEQATGPDRTQPPCLECGAQTAKEAYKKCICNGDKDYCHGNDLWG